MEPIVGHILHVDATISLKDYFQAYLDIIKVKLPHLLNLSLSNETEIVCVLCLATVSGVR
jgi:hypothetical protein